MPFYTLPKALHKLTTTHPKNSEAQSRLGDQESADLHLLHIVEAQNAHKALRVRLLALSNLAQHLRRVLATEHGQLPHGPVATIIVPGAAVVRTAHTVGVLKDNSHKHTKVKTQPTRIATHNSPTHNLKTTYKRAIATQLGRQAGRKEGRLLTVSNSRQGMRFC